MAREEELYPGAREPIWYGDRKVYTVTGFVMGVRGVVSRMPSMWLLGEISNFKYQAHLSMVYFTIKDPENGFELDCVMGRTRFEQLGLAVQDGDRVQLYGRPDLYAKKGRFSFRVSSMEHEGRGLIMQQLEALKDKLASEGLLAEERKRPIPAMPRRVGLVTGSGAAAQGDFLRNIVERFPPVQIAMIETLVQGDRAAPQVAAAIRRLGRESEVDVIVVTRGGGAFEDFLPFSDERVCRAIAESPVPVVSAIGHEKDSPLSDFVADLRVSTPTAAARTVVPDHADLTHRLDGMASAMRRRSKDRAQQRSQHLAHVRARLEARSPGNFVRDRLRHIAQLHQRSGGSMKAHIRTREVGLQTALRARAMVRQRVQQTSLTLTRDVAALRRASRSRLKATGAHLSSSGSRLHALSPMRVLERGYAIIRTNPSTGASDLGSNQWRAGTVVESSTALVAGADISIQMSDGVQSAVIGSQIADHDGAALLVPEQATVRGVDRV